MPWYCCTLYADSVVVVCRMPPVGSVPPVSGTWRPGVRRTCCCCSRPTGTSRATTATSKPPRSMASRTSSFAQPASLLTGTPLLPRPHLHQDRLASAPPPPPPASARPSGHLTPETGCLDRPLPRCPLHAPAGSLVPRRVTKARTCRCASAHRLHDNDEGHGWRTAGHRQGALLPRAIHTWPARGPPAMCACCTDAAR